MAGCSRMFGTAKTPHEKGTVTDRLVAEQNESPRPASESPAQREQNQAATGPPIATVNGQALSRPDFLHLLIQARGMSLLQQLLMRETARQEAKRLGLTVSRADIEHEYDLTLRGDQFDGKDVEALTPARREQLIKQWTRTRGVPRAELAIAMERQTYLRKIAEGRIKITDQMLRREYDRVHGEKVEVRHIQLDAKRSYAQIMQRLKQGERFEDLVLDFSQNRLSRERRGLLPPFSAHDPTVPAIFEKVAFDLKPGEVSNPIEAEGAYHVLQLVRRIPADGASFDAVQDALRRHLRARLLAEAMATLGRRLFLRSKIDIADPLLHAEYTRRRKTGQLEGPALVATSSRSGPS